MDLIGENFTFIIKGFIMTLELSLFAMLFSTVIALILGILVTLPFALLRFVIHLYVEFFRAIPLIVNIFFVYFILPMFSFDFPPAMAVIFGLSLWGSANGTEIVRGAIEALPAHQWRSAWALGMHRHEIYYHIILPQAIRFIIPPFTGLLTLIVQATSLGALVGVTEFLKVGQIIIERETVMQGTSPAFFIFGFVLVIYFVICSLLTWLSRYLERRLNIVSAREKLQLFA